MLDLKGYTLDKTCDACPEQYDVFDAKGHKVAYLRLRHGQFYAQINETSDIVYKSITVGDGMFEEDERDGYLQAAIDAIDDRLHRRDGHYDKVVRDGKVAVIFSPGFGAGWYTWNEQFGHAILFDKEIVDLILADRRDEIEDLMKRKYGDEDGYWSTGSLAIRWVPEGAAFRISEYDGSESVQLVAQMDLIVA